MSHTNANGTFFCKWESSHWTQAISKELPASLRARVQGGLGLTLFEVTIMFRGVSHTAKAGAGDVSQVGLPSESDALPEQGLAAQAEAPDERLHAVRQALPDGVHAALPGQG